MRKVTTKRKRERERREAQRREAKIYKKSGEDK